MNKNTIITILAIIGAVVVLGWVLRITFALLGPLLLIAIAVVLYLYFKKNKGSGV